jgi:hypothetical protein
MDREDLLELLSQLTGGASSDSNFRMGDLLDNARWVDRPDMGMYGSPKRGEDSRVYRQYVPREGDSVTKKVNKNGEIVTTKVTTGPLRQSNYSAQTFAYGDSPGTALKTTGIPYRGAVGTAYQPMVNRVMPRNVYAEEGPGAAMGMRGRVTTGIPYRGAVGTAYQPMVNRVMPRNVYAEEGPGAAMTRYRYPQPTLRSMGSGPVTAEDRRNAYLNYGIRNRFAPGEQFIPRDPNTAFPSRMQKPISGIGTSTGRMYPISGAMSRTVPSGIHPGYESGYGINNAMFDSPTGEGTGQFTMSQQPSDPYAPDGLDVYADDIRAELLKLLKRSD